MILDVDLDGVCANYSAGLKQYLIDTHQLDPHAHVETNQYTFTKQDGWPFDNADDYLNAHTNAERHHLYRHLPMIEHANTGLKRLAENGVHIRIVTHRLFVSHMHRLVVSDTAHWLDAHDIPYMSLCFTSLKDTLHATAHIDDAPHNIETLIKLVVSDTAHWLDAHDIPYMSLCFTSLKDTLHATAHIDDAPHNIETLIKQREHVVVFDQPYNRDIKDDINKVPRMHDWSDASVDELIEQLHRWHKDG